MPTNSRYGQDQREAVPVARQWSVTELAEELGVPKTTLRYQLTAAGVTPTKIGRYWVLTEEDRQAVEGWRKTNARK